MLPTLRCEDGSNCWEYTNEVVQSAAVMMCSLACAVTRDLYASLGWSAQQQQKGDAALQEDHSNMMNMLLKHVYIEWIWDALKANSVASATSHRVSPQVFETRVGKPVHLANYETKMLPETL